MKKSGVFPRTFRKTCALTALLLMASGCAGAESANGRSITSVVTPPPIRSGLRIAMVSSLSGVDDATFNAEIYSGITAFAAENQDAAISTVMDSTGESYAAIETVRGCLDDNDVAVLCGYQFADVSSLAAQYPDKQFILVDAAPAKINGKDTFDNVLSLIFQEEEGGFLAGIAAASETKSGKVAVVNALPYTSNVNFQYGFQSGVSYANAKYGLKVQCVELAEYAGTDVSGRLVGGNYTGSFSDAQSALELGRRLIDEGCDVLFAAAGKSGLGIFEAAKEADGVMVIGSDSDQYDEGARAGESNVVLTSILKRMGIQVQRALGNIKYQKFKGENKRLRTADDAIGYVMERERSQLSAVSTMRLSEVFNALSSGAIIPASATNGFNPNDFPGLDQS